MTHIQAELAQARQLVGGTIIATLQDEPGTARGTANEGSFGFQVRTLKGQVLDVWVDCDPEGNGPGHLEIEPDKS